MTLFAYLRSDWDANRGNMKGRMLTASFRVAQWFAQQKRGRIVWLAGLPVLIAYRILIEWVLGCELPAKTRVGPGLVIFHGQGLVVNKYAVIGAHCILRHNVTIGNKLNTDGTMSPCPVLGDRVEVGANACVIGGITVGEGAKIGAGAVVIQNVPPMCIAVGNPAKLIPYSAVVVKIAG